MKLLVTGTAGFIGYHVSEALLSRGFNVVGIDNLNDYYDVELKKQRLSKLQEKNIFSFVLLDLTDFSKMSELFETHTFDYVIHLAAQAGVRYSIHQPMKYIESNIIGFVHLLELLRQHPVKHLFYASSSSVYGNSTEVPFSENHKTDNPVSLYAATKKSNEVMMYAYSNLYGIKATGLRFFTVYGPWGRPDMAYYSFTEKILNHQPIQIFNQGQLSRDFTYIDDIVQAILKLVDYVNVRPDEFEHHNIYNIGNHLPVSLEEFISTIEDLLNVKAIREYVDMQQGDVLTTYADISKLDGLIGYQPTTTLREGLSHFIKWYKEHKGEPL